MTLQRHELRQDLQDAMEDATSVFVHVGDHAIRCGDLATAAAAHVLVRLLRTFELADRPRPDSEAPSRAATPLDVRQIDLAMSPAAVGIAPTRKPRKPRKPKADKSAAAEHQTEAELRAHARTRDTDPPPPPPPEPALVNGAAEGAP